jgi:hypothetical protein
MYYYNRTIFGFEFNWPRWFFFPSKHKLSFYFFILCESNIFNYVYTFSPYLSLSFFLYLYLFLSRMPARVAFFLPSSQNGLQPDFEIGVT